MAPHTAQNGNSQSGGNAFILAIGTANPPHYILQKDYPDFYFNITNSHHLLDLKEKFRRICDKSGIRKRHFYLTEEILKKNPHIATYGAGSLDSRQAILVTQVPELGKQAALSAILEWGQPVSKITHVVFATTSGCMIPGADYAIVKLLGLNPNVNRVMLYHQGCFAGGTALRVAKDLAENTKGARVLVVCAENTTISFHAPTENHMDVVVGQAMFSDGAAALVVGANPNAPEECPVFEMVAAGQNIVPESEGAITAQFYQMGMSYIIRKDVIPLFRKNIEAMLGEALKPLGITNNCDYNSLFYAIHPGGRGIVDAIAETLGIKEEYLVPTRHVLSEYGNMESACVIFVLDELRKRAKEANKATTGDGKEYGCLLGLGPGLTLEIIVLRSVPIA